MKGRNKIVKLLEINRLQLLIVLFFFLFPIFATSYASFLVIENEQKILELTNFKLILLYALLSIAMAFSAVPNTWVGLVSGFFFGYFGFVLACWSYFLALFLGYFLGALFDDGQFKNSIYKLYPKSEFVFEASKKEESRIVFFSRLTPFLSFSVTNLLLAWLQIEKRKYITFSMLGMLPRLGFVIWIGMQGKEIKDLVSGKGVEKYQIFSLFVLLFISLVAYFFIIREIKKRVFFGKSALKNN